MSLGNGRKGAWILYIITLGFLLWIPYSLPKSYPVTITYSPSSQEEGILKESPQQVDTTTPLGVTMEEQLEETTTSFPLDLNSASVSELEDVPGIGPVLAQRIIDYKGVLGEYSSLDQLLDIKGIGEKTYLDISAYFVLDSD